MVDNFLDGEDPHKTAIVPATDIMLVLRDHLNQTGAWAFDAMTESEQEDILQEIVAIIEPKVRAFARQTAQLAYSRSFGEINPADFNAAIDDILPASKS